jgi:hypothetical protein
MHPYNFTTLYRFFLYFWVNIAGNLLYIEKQTGRRNYLQKCQMDEKLRSLLLSKVMLKLS